MKMTGGQALAQQLVREGVTDVFGVPGLGKRITEAILAKQYPALQSYVAIVAILYVIINFVIDILYSVLDPRIRNARAVA